MMYPILTLSMIACFFLSVFKTPVTFNEPSDMPISTPKFSKLLYIVIDGLRFDAVVPVHKQGLYFNNFKFFQDPEKLKTTYLSISGIPTATTPRIISLMTGAPSTQIEELMTFLQQGVSMDCFCNKFDKNRVCAYGDDLWKHSFKIFQDNNKCFPGFSKKDIVKVEEEMVKNVEKDVEKEVKFIHFLSIDSFGHSYGTDSVYIRDSQVRIDNFLIKTFETMDQETLMVVLSDHGVTDLGAHGGNSREELSAFCGFYAKKPFVAQDLSSVHKDEPHIYNKELLSKNFDLESINQKDDYIKAMNKYKVVSQDDILPTVCYFLGKPVPTNTYGSFIPYLVDDKAAQENLLQQKLRFLQKSELNNDFYSLSIEERNYFASLKIYCNAVSSRPLYAIASLTLALILLFHSMTNIKNIISSFPYLFITFMVSHSYYSFASEDILWTLTFLMCNFSLPNIIFCMYFLKSSGRRFFTADRFHTGLMQFENHTQRVFMLAIFIIVRSINIKEFCIYISKWLRHLCSIRTKARIVDEKTLYSENYSINFQIISESDVGKSTNELIDSTDLNPSLLKTKEKNFSQHYCYHCVISNVKWCFMKISRVFKTNNDLTNAVVSSLPQLYYIAMSNLYHLNDADKMHFMIDYFSLDTMIVVHYPYEISLIFLLLLRLMKVRKNANSKLILLSLVSYFNGFEKVLQSVDYNAFYTYSTEFGSLSNLTGALAQFVVPRIYIYKKMGCFEEENLLQLYSLIVCFICSWFMNGSLVFSYFFVGRLFSVAMFFVIDLLIDNIYRTASTSKIFKRLQKTLML